ncbi:sigma-70 family RNA polymerase sigma factor [Bacillus lacus]|uniref:Sigma-70 family RNA polymerase sigma factor n=1 Tax=Metabacillus lacus TaxID=1983721 RepID=A0A7X2LVY0_9BACI|nr:sigma-70 family RNA polymerase sigma factor [Metabacillus lacus]MRX70865.1 sigma-70 family RNA polymerase sigma factor [Metabacillus lacus]
MDWLKATDKQLQAIINHDGQCPPQLLYEAVEEAVRRDLYHYYLWYFITKRFKSVRFAEQLLQMSFDDMKQIMYIKAFDALKRYKPGKYPFICFWARFMNTKLSDLNRDRKAGKREGETVTIDDEEKPFHLVSDYNVERLVLNRITINNLLSRLTPLEKEVVLWREQGYKFPEIGLKTGFTRTYMHKTYKQALAKMREVHNESKKVV